MIDANGGSADGDDHSPAATDELSEMARSAVVDEAAMRALLATLVNNRVLQPVIRRYLFNEDDVAMVEQQTLVVVAFKLDRWSGTGEFSPWVRQVAANEAKTLIRSRDRRRQHEETSTNRTVEFIGRMSSQLATEADIDRCLAQLHPDMAEPLRLRRLGYGYRDISVALGIAEGTAKTRVRNARQALANALIASDGAQHE